MKTKLFNVTPNWAADKLEDLSKRIASGAFRQRRVRERMVNRFADDMACGAWQVTHQGIAFDEKGNLLDGQHRLMAVVKAGVPVQMMVTTGLPANGVMDALDSGAPRSIANQLQVSHGYPNASLTAAVARHIAMLTLGVAGNERNSTKPPMTVANTVWVLESLNIKAAIERATAILSGNTLRASYTIAPWALYWRFNKDKAEDFLTKFQTLVNLGEGHPAMMLYRYVTSTNLRPRRDELHIMMIVCYCLQMFDAGNTIDTLRGSTVRPSREAQLWLVGLDGRQLADQIYKRLITPGRNGHAVKADIKKK